uniref:Aquaporin n=1 Tax=Rhabditophanes sp. KR3021 TaxID=114890 RepID=A0AC35U1Y9_9BILA
MTKSLSIASDSYDVAPTPRYKLHNALVAEFIGTMIFVFIGSSSFLNGNIVSIAAGHGFTIFALVASLGGVSGGHFNCAVTLSLALSGKVKPYLVPLYWIAQLGGAFVGGVLVFCVMNQTQYDQILGGSTIPNIANTWYQALIAEAILTAILTQTITMTAADTPDNILAPLAIGLSLSLSILGLGSVSGASLNPARSAGPAAAFSLLGSSELSKQVWTYHYVYWGGPFLGAAFTSILYRSFFASEQRLF